MIALETAETVPVTGEIALVIAVTEVTARTTMGIAPVTVDIVLTVAIVDITDIAVIIGTATTMVTAIFIDLGNTVATGTIIRTVGITRLTEAVLA